MLVAQLNVEPAAALARLRAHAYATDRAPTDVARDIPSTVTTRDPARTNRIRPEARSAAE